MQTRISEPVEQGQEKGTNTIPRLFFLSESASPDLIFQRNCGPSDLPGEFCMFGLKQQDCGKEPDFSMGRSHPKGRALELRVFISVPSAGV